MLKKDHNIHAKQGARSPEANLTTKEAAGSCMSSPNPLSGFDPGKTIAAVQESIYIVLGHGPYQRKVLLCGILCVTVVLLQELALHLIGRPVDHWCRPPEAYRHLSPDVWKNLSIPVTSDGSFSKCTIYDPRVPIGTGMNNSVAECHKWNYDIADKMDSIVSQFDLVCERQFLYEVCALLPILGYALLAPVAGFASDHIGRRPVTIACAVSMLLATLGGSIPSEYAFFVLTRIVAVSSANAVYLLTYILVYEVTGHTRRALFTILHVAVASIIVPPFIGVISLLQPSWMLAQGFLILPTALFVLWSFQLCESPAWLLAKWQLHKAEVIILRAAEINGADMNNAKGMFDKAVKQLKRKERHSLDTTASMFLTEGLLQTAVMRRRAVAVFFARFSISAIYYGVTINDTAKGYEWEITHVVLSTGIYATIIKAIGTHGIREILATVLVIVSFCALAEATVALVGYTMASAVVHALTKATISCALSVVLCYAGEVFPTDIRSAGVSVALFFGGLGALSGTFLTKVCGSQAQFAFNLFSAFMALLSMAAIQWLPEILVEKPKHTRPEATLSEDERKAHLKASLSTSAKVPMKRKGRNSLPDKKLERNK